jgi:hypothetical protein
MKLTWHGHSAFRIEAGAAKILIDPFLSDNPSWHKGWIVSPSLVANDELLDYIDTPKLRELYLAWCGENGFEPIAIGAAHETDWRLLLLSGDGGTDLRRRAREGRRQLH